MKYKLKYIVTILISTMTYSTVYAKVKYVKCGSIKQIPNKIVQLSHTIVDVLQIAVPVILVLFGMIDMVKAISSQNEDDIKKAQSILIKRLIMGALLYFLVVIVKLLLSAIGGNTDGIWKCVQCFISDSNKCW